MGGDLFQAGGGGGGGGSLNIIIMSGGYVLVLGHISPISQHPPLQVIIAQSLN